VTKKVVSIVFVRSCATSVVDQTEIQLSRLCWEFSVEEEYAEAISYFITNAAYGVGYTLYPVVALIITIFFFFKNVVII
jgi:hypothetical protein